MTGPCRSPRGCARPATVTLIGYGPWIDERCTLHALWLIDWYRQEAA